VVLYEMVAGRLPFGGEYEQAVIYAILNEPPRPLDLAGVFPPELAAVIERALAKDPAARYPTAEDLEEDLARLPLAAGSGPVRRRPVRARRTLHRRVRWIAAALAVLVALGSAVGVWQWRAQRWEFSPEVARLVEQGEDLEWRGDTKRILANAEQAYRQALDRDRDNPLIEAQLAALLARIDLQFPAAGRRKEIQRLTARALERAPDHPMPWVARGKLLLLENKPHEAEEAAREAVEQDSDFDRGHTVLGEALIAQGRLEEGLAAIRRGVEVGQGYLRARLTLAAKLQDASRYDEAAVELRKVLAYDPDHPTAKEMLGAIHLINGRYFEAIPLFRDVFETTRDWRSANSLAIAYFNLDRMEEAIKAFGEAFRLEPSPFLARNLAESYEKIGQTDEARRWCRLALQGFDRMLAAGVGQRAELLNSRAFCAALLGRYDEALGNVEEARKLKPQQNAFFFRAAQICAMAGRREKVYSYTRQAVEAGYSREEFRRDLAFRDFQEDPRFREILESAAR
jgi:tetratricopeptide (TPR) repeat protein